ncbi:MAG: penicillin-binding transpeptidase domain-containing protein, partial [Bdellovibrionia bacterium]
LIETALGVFGTAYEIQNAKALLPVLAPVIFENTSDNTGPLRTMIDVEAQRFALAALREQLLNLKSQNVRDGAALVLENATGRVVAYVGNGGFGFSSAHHVDGIQSRRQAGSTLKTFVYGAGFEEGVLRRESLLEDSPADIAAGLGRVYHPRNYDNLFRGLVSVADSLGSSLNVPAVRALKLVGERKVLNLLGALGFENLRDTEYYGPSLALGSLDVTLWELTNAYRKLSATADSPLSIQTRDTLFSILSSSEHRRFTFGIDSTLNLPVPTAVKTGTSKDMRDNWCVGLNDRYTVGVWVGNFNGDPMWDVSGMSGAAPAWRRIMAALSSPSPARASGAAVEVSEPLPAHSISRITYPVPDMLVAIDPDIPAHLQKLPIEIEAPQKDHVIFLDGKSLGPARDIVLWPLIKGKHKIDLKTRIGRVIETVPFLVR